MGMSIGPGRSPSGSKTLTLLFTSRSSGSSSSAPGFGVIPGRGEWSTFFCDNTAVVDTLDRERPSDRKLQELLREFLFIVCTRGFTPIFRKIGTLANTTADYISRVHGPILTIQYFKSKNLPMRKLVEVPDQLFLLHSNW